MAVTLIVTRSFDRSFDETGEEIDLDDWLALVRGDLMLALRTEPHIDRLPDGKELRIPAAPGESELVLGEERLPFLRYQEGELVMTFAEEMEASEDPRRKKVAEVARRLGALITHDADEEILDW